MKLKTKLLSIIAPAALLTTAAPIALTSCNGTQSSSDISFALVGEKSKSTSTGSVDFEFTMSREKKVTEAIVVGLAKSTGDIPWPVLTSINGTKVIVTVTLYTTGQSESNFDLDFTITDAATLEVNTVTVTGLNIKKTA